MELKDTELGQMVIITDGDWDQGQSQNDSILQIIQKDSKGCTLSDGMYYLARRFEPAENLCITYEENDKITVDVFGTKVTFYKDGKMWKAKEPKTTIGNPFRWSKDMLIAYDAFLWSEKIRHQDDIKAIDRKRDILRLAGYECQEPGPWITEDEICEYEPEPIEPVARKKILKTDLGPVPCNSAMDCYLCSHEKECFPARPVLKRFKYQTDMNPD
jgi:hypothetical protein